MEVKHIALIGNPNTGKTSLFNLLTGLNQQVGNFPGVTVEKKSGKFQLDQNHSITVTDLPGTYSLFPRSRDEKVVFDFLTKKDTTDFPEAIAVVVDASNLERNLLFFSQLYDLGLPLIMVLSMTDVADKRQIRYSSSGIAKHFPGVPIVAVNGRSGEGLAELKKAILKFEPTGQVEKFVDADLIAMEHDEAAQTKDAELRFQKIRTILKTAIHRPAENVSTFSNKLDKILVHPIAGYAIFIAVLLLIFQFIFNFANVPMDFIDGVFGDFSAWVGNTLPAGVFTDLLSEGIIPGIGGVVVFIPQIALLFFFLALLEETGYMSRVVFIMDRLMRPFGLNGKSVVPLMSSVACAIPGVMSARNISSWKDRMITIMVSPLMSCSARIPVYTLLINLVIPDQEVFGFFNLKGLVLFGLYSLGVVMALLMAVVMKFILKSRDKSFLLLELPSYKLPRLKYVGILVFEKVRVFIWDAGKVILAISIILWALASYSPNDKAERIVSELPKPLQQDSLAMKEYNSQVASIELENSYMGILGKGIEPVIRPLGYDWKMGIALLTSFAAREVFVGSMATIYSVGVEDDEENRQLIDRLRNQVNPDTGEKVYNLASGGSLMIFYVFAMQCMATLAVVKRETNSWKWPIIQLLYMGVLAYLGAFITFTLLS
jgi:ferrous iron transport protein B